MSGAPGGFFGDAPAADPDGGSTDSDSGSDDDSDLGGTAPNNGGTAGGGRGPRFDDDPVDGGGDPSPDPDPSPSGGTAGGGRGPRFDDDPVDGGGDPSPDPDPSPGNGVVDRVTTRLDTLTDRVDPAATSGRSSATDRASADVDVPDTAPRPGDDGGPGPVDRTIGRAVSAVGSSPVGGAVDRATDPLFGDGVGDGAVGSTATRLDQAGRTFDREVTDRARNADPESFGPEAGTSPAPGVGAPVAGDFAQDIAVSGAQFANLPAFGSDVLRASEVGVQVGAAVAEGRGEAVDTVGDATVDVARATPGAVREAAETAIENPQETAAGGVAAGATLGIGSAAGTAARGATRAGSRGVRSALDDLDIGSSSGSASGGSRSFSDFVDDTRAQGQIGRSRGADDDPTTITADNLRDQLSAQDRARAADLPDRGSDIDAADPIQRRRDQLARGDRGVDDRSRDEAFRSALSDGADATGQSAGLGRLNPVNDASGVAPTGGFVAGAGGTGIRLDPRNDPTGVAADSAADSRSDGLGLDGVAGGDVRLGTIADSTDPSGITDATTPTGDTDTTGIGATGGTGSQSDVAPIEDLRGSTLVGTQERQGAVTGPVFGAQVFAEPTAANEFTADTFRGGRGGGGGRGGTTRIRGDLDLDQDEDDDERLVPLGADADRIDSGLASGSEEFEDAFGIESNSDPFSL